MKKLISNINEMSEDLKKLDLTNAPKLKILQVEQKLERRRY